MRIVLVSIVAIATLAFAGCGSSDPITRLQATTEAYVDDVCSRCPVLIGSSTTELQCQAAAEAQLLSETEAGCLRDVYREHQEELDAYYDCVIPATDALARCVRASLDTCPPSTDETTACGNAFTTALAACPDLTTATATDLSVCNP